MNADHGEKGVIDAPADLSVELVQTERNSSSTPTSKVVAATAGAGAGSVIGAAALWTLGVFVWGADRSAEAANLAVAAVPAPIGAVVLLVTSAGVAFASGYLKRAGRFEVVE